MMLKEEARRPAELGGGTLDGINLASQRGRGHIFTLDPLLIW